MSVAADPVEPVFDHLRRLTDDRGLFEHAEFAEPRPEHGYCVDDAARALVVVAREPEPGPWLRQLGARYLAFTLDAVASDGRCHNRMSRAGQWSDEPGLGDWWGRALWGLGTAAALAPSRAARARASLGLQVLAQQRSPDLRAMAFAGLGAGEVLLRRPDDPTARALLADAAERILAAPSTPDWCWPEPRLSYANAALPECLLLAGHLMVHDRVTARGLELLAFLLEVETREDQLSLTPVGGRGPDDDGPGFDQQPIEVASLADACARAVALTGDASWARGVDLARRWFAGHNDLRTPMYDPVTGGGFDGLNPLGCNLNQGAESTLAALSTLQHARALGLAG